MAAKMMKSISIVLMVFFVNGCNQPNGSQVTEVAPVVTNPDLAGSSAELTPPMPLSIIISPETIAVPAGIPVVYTATGIYPYGIVKDLTTLVEWSTSDNTIAGFTDATQVNTATSSTIVGVVDVIASFKTVQGKATLAVSDAILKRLMFEPSELKAEVTLTDANEPIADSLVIKALGVFSDSSIRDLSSAAAWSIKDPTIATVDRDIPGLLHPLKPGTTLVKATVGDEVVEKEVVITLKETVLLSLTATPETIFTPLGAQQELKVTGKYSDQSTKDLSNEAEWTTANAAVMTVGKDVHGKWHSTAIGAGETKLAALVGKVKLEITAFTSAVTVSALKIEPAQTTLPAGVSQHFQAIATYTDGSTADVTTAVAWTSLDADVAEVLTEAPDIGLVKAKSAGTLKIEARFSSETASADVVVTTAQLDSITLNPTTAVIAKGRFQNFTATGHFSDGTTLGLTADASWTSGNNSLINMSNVLGTKGKATGIGLGGTTIRASVGALAKIAVVTVTAPEVTAVNVTTLAGTTVALGRTKQFRANATYSDGSTADVTENAVWTFDANSSGYTFAGYVSNTLGTKGLARSIALGKIAVTAAYNGFSETVDFTVTEKEPVLLEVTGQYAIIDMGQTEQLSAIVTYTDNTTREIASLVGDPDLTMSWTSSNPAVSAIGNGATGGLVSTVSEGGVTMVGTVTSIKFGALPAAVFNVSVQSSCDTVGGGIRNSYYCWYLSAYNQSCNEICTAHGAAYHTATSFYAGSAGTASQCLGVLTALDAQYNSLDSGAATGSLGIGCSIVLLGVDELTARFTNPATNPTDKGPIYRRACACTY